MLIGKANPRVAVLGATAEQLADIRDTLAENGVEVVAVDEAETVVDVASQGNSLEKSLKRVALSSALVEAELLIAEPVNNRLIQLANENHHGRSGSRGKGGKIKYRRT